MAKRVNLKITGSVSDGLKKYILKNIGTEGPVDVYIASPGGSCFDAQEIIVAFQGAVDSGREVNFYVASVAASAASYIPTAVKGAKLWMAKSSQLMFHGPWGYMVGGSSAFKDYASLLDKLKADIMAALGSKGVKVEEEWFAEGRMKWYSAKEALDAKIADGIRNPPPELIAAEGYVPLDIWELLFGKDKAKTTAEEIKVAASSVEALFVQEARLRFGLPETAEIKAELTEGGVTFTGVNEKIDGLLLKISTDGDTLCSINWDELPSGGGESGPVASTGEGDMAEPTKDAPDASEIAEAKQKGYDTGYANGMTKGKADGLAEGEAKGKKDAEAAFGEKEALAKLDITSDQLTYAKANYEADCAACRKVITDATGTLYSEDELKGMPFSALKKLADGHLLAKGGEAPKANREIFGAPPKDDKTPPADGEAASLPPPSDTF